jgi:ABC-type Fe3+-hydroxamate transport system substrate-binding protein
MIKIRFSFFAGLSAIVCAALATPSAEAGRTVHRVRTVTTTTVRTYVPPPPPPVVVHHVQQVPVYYPVVYRERPVVYAVPVYQRAYVQPYYQPTSFYRPFGLIGYRGGYRGHFGGHRNYGRPHHVRPHHIRPHHGRRH